MSEWVGELVGTALCTDGKCFGQSICVVSRKECVQQTRVKEREKGVEGMHGSSKTSPYSCSHNKPAVVLGIELSHVGGSDIRLGRPV